VTTPFRASQTFDPTKLVFQATGPGFNDATGVQKSVTRTFRGGAQIRLQFVQGSSPPSNTLRLASQVGTNLEVYVSLAECVYQGETLTVSAENGFYGAASVGGPVATVTNGSARAHHQPQCGFLDYPGRLAGATFTVEALAFSLFARAGQQVAAVGFYAKDASGHTTPEVIVGATSLSDIVNGQVAGTARPEVWRATLNTSGLTQGDTCNLFLNVYPWVGPKWSMETSGNVFPSQKADTALRFVADPAGTYGGAHAYVNASTGNDTTGVASLTAATARATPCATVAGALAKIKTFNSASRTPTHNDTGGGIVRLMDNAGADQVHSLASSSASTGGVGYVTVEADPTNTGVASVSLSTTNLGVCSNIRWRVNVDFGANYFSGGALSDVMIYDGITASITGSTPANYKTFAVYHLNVTAGGTSTKLFEQSFNNKAAIVLMAGCSSALGGNKMAAIATCNYMFSGAFSSAPATNQEDFHVGAIFYNNQCYKITTTMGWGNVPSRPIGGRGVAIVQNVLEPVFVGSCMRFAGDNEPLSFENVVFQLNTIPGPTATGGDQGARLNVAYADVVAAKLVNKEAMLLFNNLNNFNIKQDTFDGTIVDPTGRVGGYYTAYRVGSYGNSILKSQGGHTTYDPDGGVAGSAGGNWLGHCGFGDRLAGGNMTFVDNKAANATGGPGGGDYRLTGAANPAYGLVPAGQHVLAYDLGGTARKGDGNGAAGAYERTDI
jgi:hypothetical protein